MSNQYETYKQNLFSVCTSSSESLPELKFAAHLQKQASVTLLYVNMMSFNLKTRKNFLTNGTIHMIQLPYNFDSETWKKEFVHVVTQADICSSCIRPWMLLKRGFPKHQYIVMFGLYFIILNMLYDRWSVYTYMYTLFNIFKI